MLDFASDTQPWVNWLFLIVTGAIAWHGIRYRNEDGKPTFVHLLFGCIAAVYFFLVLFQDVLGVINFR